MNKGSSTGRSFFKASPTVKILALVSFTSAAVVLHRYFYKPYRTRSRLEKAEANADLLYPRHTPTSEQHLK